MTKILAFVILTYKEAIRKRIFLFMILVAITLVSSSAFFPVVSASDRVRLVEIWSLRGISIFGSLLAIFLAGVSISSDMEDRRIFFILTKPISKEAYLIGKFIGFVLVMVLFIFVLGLISLVYLYLVDFISNPNKSALSKPIEKIKADRFSFIQPENRPTSLVGEYNNKEEGLKVSLSGEAGNFVRWHFKDLHQYKLGSPPMVELTARILKEKYTRTADVRIIFENPTTQKIDAKIVQLTYQKPLRIDFDVAYINPLGELYVTVFPREGNTTLTVTPESLLVITAPKSFIWNFIKSLILIFLQLSLVVAIVIAGSTVLSAGVNIFMGLVVYLIGSNMDFCWDSLEIMEKAMEAIRTRELLGQPLPPDTMPLWLMETSKAIINVAFKILPDLRVFDGISAVLKEIPIESNLIGTALSYLAVYIIVLTIIGWGCFRLREAK